MSSVDFKRKHILFGRTMLAFILFRGASEVGSLEALKILLLLIVKLRPTERLL